MFSVLDNLRTGLRFTLGLRGFLKDKITVGESWQVVRKRVEQREENFLKLVKKGIFEYKKSPYLPLLKLSRYEYKDIERMVARDGLEGTLKTLQGDGVYFTIQEFKGRVRVVRKGHEFVVKERDFDNPYTASCYERRSGGTRSAGTRIIADFDFLSRTASNRGLIADAWSATTIPHVILRPFNSYGSGMIYMLHLSKFSIYPSRWISLINTRDIRVSLKNRAGISYIFWLGRLMGERFPRPEFIEFQNISSVIDAIQGFLKKHHGCCISTNVSSAVRVCLAARERGADLTGVKFDGCGEPLTATKRDVIESVGAKYALLYAFSEGGLVGDLCLNGSEIDDIHLFRDLFALITHPKEVSGVLVNAFLLTTLLSSAPKILLNVENGDYGEIETRKCGCPFDTLGYHEHIHHIRSFEKLTGEGAAYYGADLIRIIENVLPEEFGGSSLDYQLVEQADQKGLTHLFVLASPRIGLIDEQGLIKTVLDELKKGSDSYRIMAEIWAQVRTVQVRRQEPFRTHAGKQFPLHLVKGDVL